MEKIALIMNGGSRNMVISDKTLARLKTLGEVVINEGSAGKADVIRAITGRNGRHHLGGGTPASTATSSPPAPT